MSTQALTLSIKTTPSTFQWYELRDGFTNRTMKGLVWIFVMAQLTPMLVK